MTRMLPSGVGAIRGSFMVSYGGFCRKSRVGNLYAIRPLMTLTRKFPNMYNKCLIGFVIWEHRFMKEMFAREP